MTIVAPGTQPNIAKGSSRLADMVRMANGLNSARVFASILVVLLHAAIPYMVSRVPVLWLVHDSAQHLAIDVLVVWVNGFVMPLFFLLAGMSIAKSSMHKPFREFAWHRFRRLGATFLLAGVLIVPLLLVCWGIGLLWTERLTMAHLVRLRFPDELHRYLGPMHLWFLEYLLLLSIGWSAIARCAQRWSLTGGLVQGKWAHATLGSAWGPLVFAVPTAAIFAVDIDTPFRLATPFTPDVARTLHYSVFFIAGIWLAGMRQSFLTLRTHALQHLLIAAVTFVGVCPLTLAYFEKSLGIPGQWALGGLHAIFAWSMVFGFLGAMMRWCSDRRESIRYVNEASFWLYLAHFPIVCAMQLVVWPWPIDPCGKLLIVATTGVVMSLLGYHYCVRYSWLGAVINGSRKQHVKARGWRLEAGWLSLVSVSIMLLAGFLWTGWESIAGANLHPVVAGQIYRSNRLQTEELDQIITRHNIRSVISLASGNADDRWFQSQQDVCDERSVHLATLAFNEYQVPSSAELAQLQHALKFSLRPILLIGGKRSPTLSGFGSAVAILVEEGSLEDALGQLDMRYFQLEGAEHCIVAQPLRQYRDWLNSHRLNHSAERFGQWTQQVQATSAEMAAARQTQPARHAMIGAPRYPRRF
jgi:hypothetical protein